MFITDIKYYFVIGYFVLSNIWDRHCYVCYILNLTKNIKIIIKYKIDYTEIDCSVLLNVDKTKTCGVASQAANLDYRRNINIKFIKKYNATL